MAKYSINWMERKTTSTGKEKIDASLVDEGGNDIKGVTIWGDFPDFANLAPGSSVVGDVVSKQNGQYENKTLYGEKAPSAPRGAGFGVKAAQERKAQFIEEAQGRKSESIAFFNATNFAKDMLAIVGIDGMDMSKMQETIRFWRNWQLNEWKVYENSDFTDKHNPI